MCAIAAPEQVACSGGLRQTTSEGCTHSDVVVVVVVLRLLVGG